MWLIKIAKSAEKELKKAPLEIRDSFDAWKNLMEQLGPNGIQKGKGRSLKKALNQDFVVAKKYGKLTPGKALRIYRELQSLTQADLAKKSGLKQATISSLEHDRIVMGIDRAKALARALKIHPSVLAFADWDMELKAA